MGLETMLFGVSGSCDDMDATSLPVEFEPGPPSEKLTCGTRGRDQKRARSRAAASPRKLCPLKVQNGNKDAIIYSANKLVK